MRGQLSIEFYVYFKKIMPLCLIITTFLSSMIHRIFIKQTLLFFIKNEIESFAKSPVCSELYQLADKLGYHIQCPYGYGDDKKSIYLSFIVMDNNGEGVSAGEYD